MGPLPSVLNKSVIGTILSFVLQYITKLTIMRYCCWYCRQKVRHQWRALVRRVLLYLMDFSMVQLACHWRSLAVNYYVSIHCFCISNFISWICFICWCVVVV